MQTSTEIVPFWNRLREIALYPAHASALTTIFVLALAHLVRFIPFGWALDLLVWVALYKYAFECLRASADGRLEPPEVGFTVEDDLGWKQIWLQAIFLVLIALALIVLGPVFGMIVALVLGLAWPGAVMSLAMDESLGHALNPATWLSILARIGGPYLAVVGLYFVFFISERYAQQAAVMVLPAFLAIIIVNLISHYAIVATFHLMGYLIYQYHEEVGYEPAAHAARLPDPKGDPDQQLLDDAADLVRDGETDAACDMLASELRSRGGTEAVHAQYRKLLALGGRRDEQLRHGREWISMLLAQDRDRRAVDVARECVDLDAEFEPSSPDEVARIADKAVETGATQVALRLVSVYYRKHPRHRDVPRNGLLAAKLLAERMGKDATARTLLDRILKAFPNDPLAPEIVAYRRFLDRIAGAPAARGA